MKLVSQLDWLRLFPVLIAAVGSLATSSAQPRTAKQPVPGTVKTNPKDGLKYVWIPPGRFMMGCSPGDAECGDDEKPSHEVTLTKGFWMGETEVTQAAYQKVTGNNPSASKGANLPVESVSWEDAQAYCRATGGRLPTEAEWEYAARAGSTGSRYGDLDQIAWYRDISAPREVGKKQANAWGLYDMLGNVWEWVADWYAGYPAGSQRDPAGPSKKNAAKIDEGQGGESHVMRGGSWGANSMSTRASVRGFDIPWSGESTYGFRCAGS